MRPPGDSRWGRRDRQRPTLDDPLHPGETGVLPHRLRVQYRLDHPPTFRVQQGVLAGMRRIVRVFGRADALWCVAVVGGKLRLVIGVLASVLVSQPPGANGHTQLPFSRTYFNILVYTATSSQWSIDGCSPRSSAANTRASLPN